MAIASLRVSVILVAPGVDCVVIPCCGAGAAGRASFIDSRCLSAEVAAGCAIEAHTGHSSRSKTATRHLTKKIYGNSRAKRNTAKYLPFCVPHHLRLSHMGQPTFGMG